MGRSSTPRWVPARSTLIPTRPGPILVAQPAKNNSKSANGTATVANVAHLRIGAFLLFMSNLPVRRHVMMPNPRQSRRHKNKERKNNQNAPGYRRVAGTVHQVKSLRYQVHRPEENQDCSRVEKSRFHPKTPNKEYCTRNTIHSPFMLATFGGAPA